MIFFFLFVQFGGDGGFGFGNFGQQSGKFCPKFCKSIATYISEVSRIAITTYLFALSAGEVSS